MKKTVKQTHIYIYNIYISVHEHGDGCWQIYYVGVHGATAAGFMPNFRTLNRIKKTKYAIT